MYLEILKMSASSLRANKVRSFLTTLGIIIGTAIVVIMLSVGAGVKNLILTQLSDITPETLYIEIRVPSSASGKTAKDANTASSISGGVQITTLKVEDTEAIRELPNIQSGYSMSIGQGKISYRNKEKTSMMYLVESSYPKLESLKLQEGRFFSAQEDKSLAQVLVLGSDLKTSLFGSRKALNETVKINGRNYKVVGIAEKVGTKMFLPMDDFAYIPIRTAQKKIQGVDYIQAMALKMNDKTLIESTILNINRLMRKRHNIKDPEKDDFVIRTQEEAMEIVGTVTSAITFLLFSIALISLIVGGVGVMNVMFVSVSERTNEIGIKKAIGAKPYLIKMQFLSEAIAISFLGGILGALIGIGVSALVSYVASFFNFEWPLIIDSKIILLAFSASVFVGIAFGYGPAKKAAGLNPIEALRSS